MGFLLALPQKKKNKTKQKTKNKMIIVPLGHRLAGPQKFQLESKFVGMGILRVWDLAA
jgi:hypothetical protein